MNKQENKWWEVEEEVREKTWGSKVQERDMKRSEKVSKTVEERKMTQGERVTQNREY